MEHEDILASQWKQLRDKVKERWHALSDEDVKIIDGHRDILVEMLQGRYAYNEETAEEQVKDFLKEFARPIPPSP